MERTLIIIANDYPFGYGEPFLEGDLAAFATGFSKIYIVLPEKKRVDISRNIFPLPVNAEVIFLNCGITVAAKIRAITRVFTSRAIAHLKEIVREYQLPLSPMVLKTMLAYEARDMIFRRNLSAELRKRNIKPDPLYFYTCWLTDYTFSLSLFKKEHPSIKVFSRMHGWDVYFERHRPAYLPYRKHILEGIDLVAAISDNGKSYLEQKIKGVKQGKITVFRLGVDRGEFKPDIANSHCLNLLTLSFIRPVKQLEMVIEALSEIPEVDITWHHIGGGEEAYSKKIMDEAATKLGNRKNIRFVFHGTMDKEELYHFLTKEDIDVIVNTSSSEGLPVSIMEAMAHSIPAIAPRVGGIPEIVEHDFNGFLMSPASIVEDLKKYMAEYAAMSQEEKSRLRANAYQTWNDKFNLAKNSESFLNAVLRL